MNTRLIEQVFNLIREYEKEREPDILISTEYKNSKRLSCPILQEYHSVSDLKKWLLERDPQ